MYPPFKHSLVDDPVHVSCQTTIFAKMRTLASQGRLSPELKQLRAKVQTCQENRAFRDLFASCWSILASDYSEFHVPPAYTTTQEYAFKNMCDKLFSKERNRWAPGGHQVLFGFKGVGKTTLQFVVGLVSAVLLEKCIPVYWDFSVHSDASVSATDLINHGISKCYDICSDDIYSPLLLLDEFTDLYGADGGRNVIVDIHNLAKNYPNVMVVMCTSKANVDA